MNTKYSRALQEGIIDILESNKKEEFIKGTKIKQARLIVSLRGKQTKNSK